MTKKKLPKAPDYLDEIAKSQWQSKIKVLAERGDITSEDYTNLELYCVNYSLYRQAVQNIAERGFSIFYRSIVELFNGSGHKSSFIVTMKKYYFCRSYYYGY